MKDGANRDEPKGTDTLYRLKRVEADSTTQREATEKIGVTPRWER